MRYLPRLGHVHSFLMCYLIFRYRFLPQITLIKRIVYWEFLKIDLNRPRHVRFWNSSRRPVARKRSACMLRHLRYLRNQTCDFGLPNRQDGPGRAINSCIDKEFVIRMIMNQEYDHHPGHTEFECQRKKPLNRAAKCTEIILVPRHQND